MLNDLLTGFENQQTIYLDNHPPQHVPNQHPQHVPSLQPQSPYGNPMFWSPGALRQTSTNFNAVDTVVLSQSIPESLPANLLQPSQSITSVTPSEQTNETNEDVITNSQPKSRRGRRGRASKDATNLVAASDSTPRKTSNSAPQPPSQKNKAKKSHTVTPQNIIRNNVPRTTHHRASSSKAQVSHTQPTSSRTTHHGASSSQAQISNKR